MGRHIINVSLSEQSVNNAIRELQQYKADFERKLNEFTRKLALEGMYIARANLAAYPDDFHSYDVGEIGVNSSGANKQTLISSISWKVGDVLTDSVTYYVYTGNPYAKFVEFGTGIIGKENPHPDPTWDYDIHQHGEKGWFYYGSDNHAHWTKGMPSRPFMYDITIELSKRISKIAREVFS